MSFTFASDTSDSIAVRAACFSSAPSAISWSALKSRSGKVERERQHLRLDALSEMWRAGKKRGVARILLGGQRRQ